MVTIDRDVRIATLINVFHVKPENQQALVELLVTMTEGTMRRLPGFVSASIHRSLDGKRVVNYAQWQAKTDFVAMMQNDLAKPHLEKVMALAESADPMLYEVVETIRVEE